MIVPLFAFCSITVGQRDCNRLNSHVLHMMTKSKFALEEKLSGVAVDPIPQFLTL